ncbi:MAG: hypothetical protein ACP5F0_00715 [Sulfurihydrogenibium sp.]
MEDNKLNQVLKLYSEITGRSFPDINPRETEILESLLKDYGYNQTVEILKIFKESYQPSKNVKSIVSQLVKVAKAYNEAKTQPEKKEDKPEKPQEITDLSEDIINIIVRKFNLRPKKDILNVLDDSLKKFYISELVYKKIWENLTPEEKKEYQKKAIAFVKTLNITDKKKLQEAIHYRIKYLIKKDYNVLF